MGCLFSYIAITFSIIASVVTIIDYAERKKKRRSDINSKRRFDK